MFNLRAEAISEAERNVTVEAEAKHTVSPEQLTVEQKALVNLGRVNDWVRPGSALQKYLKGRDLYGITLATHQPNATFDRVGAVAMAGIIFPLFFGMCSELWDASTIKLGSNGLRKGILDAAYGQIPFEQLITPRSLIEAAVNGGSWELKALARLDRETAARKVLAEL